MVNDVQHSELTQLLHDHADSGLTSVINTQLSALESFQLMKSLV